MFKLDMYYASLALFSLQILGTISTPFYLRIRGQMSGGKFHKYSKKKILKDVLIHFLLMFFITGHFVFIMYSLLNGSEETSQKLLFYSALQVLFLAGALYGSGMYISAVLFETITRKTFFITRIIHGPLSHGIMYGAYLASFGNLANIARYSQNDTNFIFPLSLFLLLGILGGYSAGVSAISSGIYGIYSILASGIGVIFLGYYHNFNNPFVVHFLGFSASSFLTVLTFIFWRHKNRRTLSWYQPFNFSKIRRLKL